MIYIMIILLISNEEQKIKTKNKMQKKYKKINILKYSYVENFLKPIDYRYMCDLVFQKLFKTMCFGLRFCGN